MPSVFKDDDAPGFVGIIIAAIVVSVVIASMVTDSKEEQKKIESDPQSFCISEYSNTSIRYIPSRCMKYFIK